MPTTIKEPYIGEDGHEYENKNAYVLKNARGFEGMSSTMEAIRRYRHLC